MTHAHLNWARRQKVGNPVAQFLLEELAYRARSGSNECVVSHAALADRLQTTVKRIQRAMKAQPAVATFRGPGAPTRTAIGCLIAMKS